VHGSSQLGCEGSAATRKFCCTELGRIIGGGRIGNSCEIWPQAVEVSGVRIFALENEVFGEMAVFVISAKTDYPMLILHRGMTDTGWPVGLRFLDTYHGTHLNHSKRTN